MTKFTTPKAENPYNQMWVAAAKDALKDAGIEYKGVQEAYTGWVYGDTCAGERVTYELGMTGIPVFNVNNACATGSNALYLAHRAVAGGMVECAIAIGFEQMTPGALGATGLAQCSELVWQLRGEAGVRQVEGAKIGLQHNIGLGGCAVLTVYRKD